MEVSMKKSIIACLAIILTISISQPVFGQGCRGPDLPGMGLGVYDHLIHAPWHRVEAIAKDIGLNDSQVTQLKKIRNDFRHTIQPKIDQTQILRAELSDLLDSQDSTKKDAVAIAENLSKIHSEILIGQIDIHFNLAQVLTADQKDKLKSCLADKRENRRHDRKMRREERMERNRDPENRPDDDPSDTDREDRP
jgi:Spy/CpxP family protein refolding chaperone